MATDRELKIRKLFIKKIVNGVIWFVLLISMIKGIDIIVQRYGVWLEAIWANGTDVLGVSMVVLMPPVILFAVLLRCYQNAQDEVEYQELVERVANTDKRIKMTLGKPK